MIVVEMYPAIQGEGPTCGRPALFIRLGGCNLRCSWCDSKYANEAATLRTLPQTEPPQLVNKILRYWGTHPLSGIVLTGGEPLLQDSALAEVWSHLPAIRTEVETAGTIVPKRLDKHVTQYNVSFKLSNSGNARERCFTEAAYWFANSEKAYFKFVVTSEEDLREIGGIVREYDLPCGRVWLMAEGTTGEQQRQKLPWVFEEALKAGYNVSPRLHVMAYDARRRV